MHTPVDAVPQTKPTDLDRVLLYAATIHIRHRYLFLLNKKWTIILPYHGGWKVEWTWALQ